MFLIDFPPVSWFVSDSCVGAENLKSFCSSTLKPGPERPTIHRVSAATPSVDSQRPVKTPLVSGIVPPVRTLLMLLRC